MTPRAINSGARSGGAAFAGPGQNIFNDTHGLPCCSFIALRLLASSCQPNLLSYQAM